MASPYLLAVQGLLALAFVLMATHKRTDAWWLLAFLFTILASSVRLSISMDSVRDFEPYFRSFRQLKYGTVPQELLFEPYRLGLWKSILLLDGLDSNAQIAIAYFFHFAVVTAFFIWLAYLKGVGFEAKIILFLAFYPPMAFVWIKAGMAYVVACFLFIVISNRSKLRVLHFAPILFHASLAVFVAVMKSKDLRPVLRVIVLVAGAAAAYLLLESSYAQYVGGKLDHYAATADERTSNLLLLFQVANVLTFAALALLSEAFRRNLALWALMAICMGMYLVNPVVGVRLFPLVLIACLVQGISFPRYRHLTFWIAVAYTPVYFFRFDEIIIASV